MSRIYERKIAPAYSVHPPRRFYITIKFSEDGNLSFGGSWLSKGQIYDSLSDSRLIPNKSYDYADLLKIQELWKRWHLNHLRTGTPKQEHYLRNLEVKSYEDRRKALDEAGLLHDNGCEYGTSWHKEEVPDEVIKYLFTLPSCDDSDSYYDINPVSINEDDFFDILDL